MYRDAVESGSELLESGTVRRLRLAADVSASEREALRGEQERWASAVDELLRTVDVLLLPTLPVRAPAAEGADTVETTAQVVPYTHVLSFAHVPSLSLPCGVDRTGAPVGVQLAAARWRDGTRPRARRGAAVADELASPPARREAGGYAGSIRTTSYGARVSVSSPATATASDRSRNPRGSLAASAAVSSFSRRSARLPSSGPTDTSVSTAVRLATSRRVSPSCPTASATAARSRSTRSGGPRRHATPSRRRAGGTAERPRRETSGSAAAAPSRPLARRRPATRSSRSR